ncbi:hypothetical protein [Sulfuriferula thiophila]|uniref:hypothetical protein n=1 Tax=Sulfuriferula thiophila TaxID=1781211 RepID=UPI001CB91DD9|nr:hypothetical protein [Sulfuriferula thiophila]
MIWRWAREQFGLKGELASDSASVLPLTQALLDGQDAALIGYMQAGRVQVVLHTPLGGTRMLDELEDDPLPRIC